MAENKDNIFDLVDPEQKKPSNGWALPLVGLFLFVAFGTTFYMNRSKIFGGSSSTTTQTADQASPGTAKPTGYDDYINFAERFYIAAFNLSYSNYSEQIDKASKLMSPDLADYYKTDFLDTAFRQKILMRKMYVVFQRSERSQIETVTGDQVVVRVSGDTNYNSDVDGSQIQLHQSMLINVVKKGDTFQVINFQLRP